VKDQDVNPIFQFCFCSLFKPSRYFTRSRSKFLMSCTARFLTSESILTKRQASSGRRSYALINAIFPVLRSFVSILGTTVGRLSRFKIKWFKAVSRIPCILMTKVQSSSLSRESNNFLEIPAVSYSHFVKSWLKASDSVSGVGIFILMP